MLDHVGTGSTATRRYKTLVVDDEPDLADIAGELLTYHGIDAFVVYSAHDALKVLEAQPDFDAVFSDVMMPSMTGLELADTVATMYPSMRIVLTSGFTAPSYWKRQTRRFSFITKPYSIDAVIDLLGCRASGPAV
jgi:CheY-like chemotaxis protein